MVKIQLSNWMSAQDIRDGKNSAVFPRDGVWKLKEETGFERDVLQMPVKFDDGSEKDWTLNFASLKALTEAYGDETEDWVGKTVLFSLVKVNVKGTIRDSIIGEPIEEKVE